MKKKKINSSALPQVLPPAGHRVPQPLFRVKIIKGPHKGASYKLVGSKVTLGRSSKNDIILDKDDKCSRNQAVIQLGKAHPVITDVSQRASLKINNQVALKAKLKDGDLIQFGKSVLQYEAKNQRKVSSKELVRAPMPLDPMAPAVKNPKANADSPLKLMSDPGELQSAAPEGWSPPPDWNKRRDFSRGGNKSAFFPRLIILSMVIGVAYLLLSESPPPKTDEDRLSTLRQREETVKTLSELREEEKKKRTRNLLINVKNAQAAYVKGIRDYRKGVYIRAIEAFRVCKTLDPQHELCGSYLKKANIKRHQLIQAWMVAGKSYREKRRFEACMSSFKNVMQAVRNKKNVTYREALENYNLCKLQYEVRY